MKKYDTLKIVSLLIVLATIVVGCKKEIKNNQHRIEDGIYLLKGMGVLEKDLSFKDSETIVPTNSLFEHNKLDINKFYLIDNKEYVPLKTAKMPTISANSNPKIEGDTIRLSQLKIELSPKYAKLLESFTTKYVNQKITIVIGEKAITKHVIREPITGGKIQISRCTDEACTVLLSEMGF
jgi:preprotein translocase subunit SecD